MFANMFLQNLSISKMLDEACPSWQLRAQLGDQPGDLARPRWLRLASCGSIATLARTSWFDLASTGSIRLLLVPWLARFGCSGGGRAPGNF